MIGFIVEAEIFYGWMFDKEPRERRRCVVWLELDITEGEVSQFGEFGHPEAAKDTIVRVNEGEIEGRYRR